MMRSVTRETIGLSGMSRPLLVPADAVALRQRDRRRGAPRSGRIGSWSHALVGPGGANAVDPGPLRLDLVAANEQRWITLDQVEQQPLIGDAAAVFAECVRESQIERDLAPSQPLAVQPGSRRHHP